MERREFEIACEIQPPTRPDLMAVRHQIGVLSKIASAFLIPDNHLGRATISSVAVAHEVDLMGGRSIACLNARDRNLLGFRRDLMTSAAYGVDEFLLVFGDRPAAGERTGQLTVRSMLSELRRFSDSSGPVGPLALRVGVTTRLTPLVSWKKEADFLFVQASFDLDALLRWRDTIDFPGRIFAGVLVPPSASRARKWVTEIPEVDIPDSWMIALDADPAAGVDHACELAADIRNSGGFDGVHLIPGVKYREVALRLEGLLA
jgi:5,10-methylenetetrahydrofolate reductase